MMGFWGRIFGTEKALNTVVEGVSSGIDKLIYTDEEKAEAAAADRSEARKMVVGWMQATQGQNLARRLIALSITGVWLSMYLLAALTSMIAVFTNSDGVVTSEKLLTVGKIANSLAVEMNPAVMLILAFYFAAPHMSGIANAVTERFKSQVNRK